MNILSWTNISNVTFDNEQIKNCKFYFNLIYILKNKLDIFSFSKIYLIRFINCSFLNINGGTEILMYVNWVEMNLEFYDCTFFNLTLMGEAIMKIYDSHIKMDGVVIKYYYPKFASVSFSEITLNNCQISDSIYKVGVFESVAFDFSQSNYFKILNTSFVSLKNNLFGPVMIIIFFNNFFFNRQSTLMETIWRILVR